MDGMEIGPKSNLRPAPPATHLHLTRASGRPRSRQALRSVGRSIGLSVRACLLARRSAPLCWLTSTQAGRQRAVRRGRGGAVRDGLHTLSLEKGRENNQPKKKGKPNKGPGSPHGAAKEGRTGQARRRRRPHKQMTGGRCERGRRAAEAVPDRQEPSTERARGREDDVGGRAASEAMGLGWDGMVRERRRSEKRW